MSPIRPSLYRSARWAVICALLALSIGHVASAQLARRAKQNKGPRAVGLLELSSDGKARLIPIAIMIDGKFYDAGAYKASPVPLALWGQTVYEAERTGVSQGLFTVGDAIKAGNSWFGDGKWQPAGSAPKKHADKKPKLDDEDEGPPKLRRPDAEKPAAASAPPAPPEAKTPSSPPPAPTASASPTPASSTTPAPATPKAPAPAAPTPSQASSKNADEDASDEDQSPTAPTAPTNTTANDEDPNRPVLARGKIETLGSIQHPAPGTAASGPASKSAPSKAAADKIAGPTPAGSKPTTPSAKTTQLIPAISDAGGPDPRPYAYDLKPDEEQKIRKKMLALATEAIAARAKPGSAAAAATSASRPGTPTKHAAKGPQPIFDDVQFHAFDLWNTNEPVFVLSAKAQMPKSSSPSPRSASTSGASSEPLSDFTYFITLVVKQDIYGDLRKLNVTVTDTLHLDETPRLELIDAVDADGDGRGELLFRQISDAGTAWGIYRAGADQLFPLFEGTP